MTRSCSVDGCSGEVHGKDLCQKHYFRLYRTGSPVGSMRRPTIERLMEKVRVTESCWLWEGAADELGYGQISVDGGSRKAYRVAYELLVGPIPEGLAIDHLCRVPACVNPDHLEPVTTGENTRRALPFRTRVVRETCSAGHPLTDANLVVERGRRLCRTCRNEKARLRYVPKIGRRGHHVYLPAGER